MNRKRAYEKKEKLTGVSLLRRALLILVIVFAVAGASFLIYTSRFYHAGETAQKYMQNVRTGAESVTIRKEKNDWLFDGPGRETAVIFYPGALVQAEAYAPVLYQTAEKGFDCFLVKMPLHLALFGMNRAEDIIRDNPEYSSFYMAGHSLGGAMAGNFAAEHKDQVDGVIFLAAYPTKSLEGLRVLSLYGSEDGVLNRKHYEKSMSLMPEDFTEKVIEGGNHGQFGDYGKQKGDGTATISPAEQWQETSGAAADFLQQ